MTLIDEIGSKRFWTSFAEKAAEQRVPFRAALELTHGCNMRCVHCLNPTHKAKDELTTEQICRILDDLAEQGTFDLNFTGGEIFTRKDCFEILEYAKRKGFSIVLFTNATMITSRNADRIQELRPHSVEVSIYGATKATYERVTGLPGSFTRFLKGVTLLRERNVPLLIKMPVMTLNQHEVQDARELVEGWGIRFVYSTEIHPRQDGSLEPLRYRLDPEDVVRVHEQMTGYKEWRAEGGGEKDDGCNGREGLFTCSCGQNKLAVSPHGRMNLCVSLPVPQYDLRTGTVASGWRALKDFVDSARPSEAFECPSCELEACCRQGPNNAWLERGDLSPCLPYFRELAQLEDRARKAKPE